MNVVFLPGLMGSELFADQYVITRRIWLNYAAVAGDGIALLALNNAGTGPLPLLPLKSWIVGNPIGAYYGPLLDQLGNAHDVRALGYDWRLSIKTLGQSLASKLLALAPGGSVAIVAHSMGGLVARAAWKFLTLQGKGSTISRLVTLGTPHFGSLSSPRAWARLEPTYQRIVALVSTLRFLNFALAAGLVDPIIAGFPSIYEMMPFKNSGPTAPDRILSERLYARQSYQPFAPWVRQDRLDGAVAVQDWLADAGIPAQTTVIQGTGLSTPNQIKYQGAALGLPLGYGYGIDGDSTVSAAFGTLPNAAGTVYLPNVAHSLMCVEEQAISAVLSALL